LDYLGDIGGLFGTFTGLASVFTLILNFNGVYHLMTASLFTAETSIANEVMDGGNSAEDGQKKPVNKSFQALFAGVAGRLNK